MAVRPLTTSAAPKASRSAPKNSAKGATKKGPKLPEGQDESGDELVFDDAPAAPAKGKAKPAASKPAAAPKPTGKPAAKKGGEITLTFVLEKETAGAGQYCELDENGKKLGIKEACMGKPYLRKDKVGGVLPKTFKAVISW